MVNKRAMHLVLCILIAVSLSACGSKRESETDTSAEVTEEVTEETAKVTDVKEPIPMTSEAASEAPAGMANPVVEYGSFDEINEITGVSLMKPTVMGISDEHFSVINGTVAQYTCDINGMEWTFRGACITDEDISGMYSEHNVFVANQDSGLYTNEFYLDRFFDGNRQYTIVVKNPIEDGRELIDEMTFSDCCMELKMFQQMHMDDPVVGDYQNSADEQMVLYVERRGDEYSLSVNKIISESELTCWTMSGAVKDGDRLTYRGEEIGSYAYDAEGNEISSDVTAVNNIGFFEIKDGCLFWTGAAQEECRACVFEKTDR